MLKSSRNFSRCKARASVVEKRQGSYSETMNFIRTKICFALLRSAILCIRGCISLRKTRFIDNSISAVVEEGRLK